MEKYLKGTQNKDSDDNDRVNLSEYLYCNSNLKYRVLNFYHMEKQS